MIRQTSIQTYHQLMEEGKLGRRQKEILSLIKRYPGKTDKEYTLLLGHTDSNFVRPRRNELVKQGIVIEDGKRKCNITGRLAITWKVPEEIQFTPLPKYKTCPHCGGRL